MQPKTKPRADAFDAPTPTARPAASRPNPAELERFVGGRASSGQGSSGRTGRPTTRAAGSRKLLVYLTPEMYEDLEAGKVRYRKPMTTLIEELIADWAKDNRDDLDAAKKALRAASGR
jgi:hypothetical protein